jgi:replicative DNA helicase
VTKANYKTADSVFDGWRDDVLTGNPPKLFKVGKGELERIEIGPNRILLLGGPPGAGKTAFTMQAVVDALRLDAKLRVVVCNIEMTPEALLDRQLARISGVELGTIRLRTIGGYHADRIDQALQTLEPVLARLCFVSSPYDLGNVAATADDFGADLLVLDYIQRIKPPGDWGDRRGSVDACMNYLRQFADEGIGVIVVAAVSRQKDKAGRSSYAGDALTLASFRESSELEFGADDAYILVPKSVGSGLVTLKHLKARHSEPCDIALDFDGGLQRFTTEDSCAEFDATPSGPSEALTRLWDSTGAATEAEGGHL